MCAIDGIKSWHIKTNLDEKSLNILALRFNRNQHGGYSMNGSLHKHYNKGLHNADDYYLSHFKKTLNSLYDNFGLNPDITLVNGLEFGVNVKLPFSPNHLIQKIILYKSNSGSSKCYYKEFEYDNYSVKIYNKSELTDIEPYHSENILRIEIKVNKMIYLKKQGIYCKVISDLLDGSILKSLEKMLIGLIDDCLIIDFSENEINSLSYQYKILYFKYINPSYWVNLHVNRRAYSKERARCVKFIEKHSISSIKSEIKELIYDKCEELRDPHVANLIPTSWDKITGLYVQNGDKITVSQNPYKLPTADEITVLQVLPKNSLGDKITVFQNETKSGKTDKFTIKINSDFVAIESNENETTKHCKSCGRVISNSKQGQRFCSPKEVGERQAHRCRNSDSNPRNKTKQLYNKINAHKTLFDIGEFIRPDRSSYLFQ